MSLFVEFFRLALDIRKHASKSLDFTCMLNSGEADGKQLQVHALKICAIRSVVRIQDIFAKSVKLCSKNILRRMMFTTIQIYALTF